MMSHSALEHPPAQPDLPKKVWGTDPDTLLRELVQVISTGIRDAASELLYSYSTFPEAPPPDVIKQLLNVLLNRIQPVLKQEFVKLNQKAKQKVFALPKTDLSKLITVIENKRAQEDTQAEAQVDKELAAVRAELRDVEMRRRQFESLKQAMEGQTRVLQGLETAQKNRMKEVGRSVEEAEREFEESVRILKENGQGDNAVLKAAAEAVGGDEHAPVLTVLPEARGILREWNSEDMAGLRDRLMG